jgi:toxin YoeB
VKIVFSDRAWDDYLYWQQSDKNVLRRINDLIKEIERSPFEGIGKPEPLKHNLSGFCSRRINSEHRIVYRIDNAQLEIASCRYHY